MSRPFTVSHALHRAIGCGARACAVSWLAAAALFLSPALARAQSAPPAAPQEPAGRWWLGGGGGYLAVRSDCTTCDAESTYRNESGVLVQGGIRVTGRLLAGAEMFTAARTLSGSTYRDTYLLGLVQYRPFGNGFFIKGGYGVGLVTESLRSSEGTDVKVRTWGIGLTYGAGWMFRASRRVDIAPVAAHYVTTVGDVNTSLGVAENVVINGWFVGAVLMLR